MDGSEDIAGLAIKTSLAVSVVAFLGMAAGAAYLSYYCPPPTADSKQNNKPEASESIEKKSSPEEEEEEESSEEESVKPQPKPVAAKPTVKPAVKQPEKKVEKKPEKKPEVVYAQKHDIVVEQSKDKNSSDSFRGYKQTSDGRKTSYFHRELSQEEKDLLGDCSPKKIDPNGATENSDSAPRMINSTTSSTVASSSAWNAAGTFEEKDITGWTIDRFTTALKGLEYKVLGSDINDSSFKNCKIKVAEVVEIEGDAVVALARGKKKYVFDISAEIQWRATFFVGEEFKAISGKMMLSEITSACDIEFSTSSSSPVDKEISSGYRKLFTESSSKHSLPYRIRQECEKILEEMKSEF